MLPNNMAVEISSGRQALLRTSFVVLESSWVWGCLKESLTHISGLRRLREQGLVLLHSGSCNRLSQTGWLIHKRNIFLTVQEAGSSRPWLWKFQCLVRPDSWFINSHLLTVLTLWKETRELSWVSFTRALIPFMGTPPT